MNENTLSLCVLKCGEGPSTIFHHACVDGDSGQEQDASTSADHRRTAA